MSVYTACLVAFLVILFFDNFTCPTVPPFCPYPYQSHPPTLPIPFTCLWLLVLLGHILDQKIGTVHWSWMESLVGMKAWFPSPWFCKQTVAQTVALDHIAVVFTCVCMEVKAVVVKGGVMVFCILCLMAPSFLLWVLMSPLIGSLLSPRFFPCKGLCEYVALTPVNPDNCPSFPSFVYSCWKMCFCCVWVS